ncbi:hypothetical protein SAZ10_15740 [Mesorhizobium sp. BAC0120]|nr:hypothetical protein [Mesorhizobium sp. BAC0120]MDW6023210.1 hypothetical protein [Mesorhizobium sp. BAC0120]
MADRLHDPRLLDIGRRDVGQRRLRYDVHLAGIGHDQVDDRVDGVLAFRSLGCLREIGSAHAVGAEELSGIHRLSQHRQRTPGIDRNLAGESSDLQSVKRVLDLLAEVDIAVANGDGLQGDARRLQCQ